MTPSPPSITGYGASWCADFRHAQAFLVQHHVPSTWVDLEQHPEAQEVVARYHDGKRIIPTIVLGEAAVLVEPSHSELADKLELPLRAEPEAEETVRTLLMIGSGPAGYTAALHAARANLQQLVSAGYWHGGQLTLTTAVENYPGFQGGILGPTLRAEMRDRDVTAVDFSWRPFTVASEGEEEYAEAVMVASGAAAKGLGVPGEARYRGFGVSSCASCDGFFFRGQRILTCRGPSHSALAWWMRDRPDRRRRWAGGHRRCNPPGAESCHDEGREEVLMDRSQFDRIARILYRISDSNERDEVTREIAQVLAEAEPSFDTRRFYELANVAYLEER